MTLDEHIHKAEEDAKMAEFDTEWGIGNYFIDRSEALEYAKECRQLAEWLKDYKRLLEQEPSDDCISRQAALDCFTATKLKKFDFILYAREEIKKLPSVKTQETKWIPVSEGLPKDIKPVIVTWKNTDPEPYYQHIVGKHFVGTAHYNGSRWFWYSSVTEDMLAEYGQCITEEFCEGIEVIAWMPLPKPYLPDTNTG